PGNVRELENLVERISVCVESPQIALATLPPDMRSLLGCHGDVPETSFALSADQPAETVTVEVGGELLTSPAELQPPAPVIPMTPPAVEEKKTFPVDLPAM